ERLRPAGSVADTLEAQTQELLGLGGQGLQRGAALDSPAADDVPGVGGRPATEAKRQDQVGRHAVVRGTHYPAGSAQAAGARPPAAKNLAALLESYYRELSDLEEKEENLKKQRAEVEQLVGLTQKEAALLKGTLPLIEKQVAQYTAAREEEMVLVKARLKPDQA